MRPGQVGPPDPRGLVLYTSDDAGVAWTPHSELVALRYGVFDLLLVEREGQDWLFIATDRGVHRWSDESTAIMPGTWSQTKRFYRPAASPRSY